MEAKLDTSALEKMSEEDLQMHILSRGDPDAAHAARFVLGKLLIDGTSDSVPKNEQKGLNWIKEAMKGGHIPALEYKTYWDIRFDRQPNLEKIVANLEKIVAANKSTRACNTLAELNHASGGAGKAPNATEEQKLAAHEKAKLAARYYMTSAEQGDVLACHWVGAFYHEGFGLNKDVKKAVEYLEKAAAGGNGQSMYHLFQIHSGKDGQVDDFKDPIKAYRYLSSAIQHGVTYFDEAISYFKEHYDVLAEDYVKRTKLQIEVNDKTKADVLNMHKANISEMRVGFSNALAKDRLYHRPCGFINDQQIWMLGVQLQYYQDSVLRMDHADFMVALRTDLGPVLGDVGLWSLNALQQDAKDSGDKEGKKKLQTAIDILENYMEHGMQELSLEKKYKFKNKYGPAKCPDQQVKRSELKNLYSWSHYAPLDWFTHIKKQEKDLQNQREGKVQLSKLCSACQSPEGETLKHKVCSACKTRFYCSTDCQRTDWKNGHKGVCKEHVAKKQQEATDRIKNAKN